MDGMQRLPRIALASLFFLVALAATAIVATAIPLDYVVPDGDGGTVGRVAVFEPAVAGTVIAGVLTLFEIGFLVWCAVRTPPRFAWVVAALLAVAAIVVVVVVTNEPRPVF